ncbi:MAG: chitobiase/beta-hexosaminidase C-terminal domain-containing protein [Firmicutes bacterium]|nr:chitobiase/beta-hexosaminidase C-terminal domain-containing protein [Bacillota bacterium]
MKKSHIIIIALPLLLLLASCAPSILGNQPVKSGNDENTTVSPTDDSVWRIRVTDMQGSEALNFSEQELAELFAASDALLPEQTGLFTHMYSTVNNWPASHIYAASGYSVAAILTAAGLKDNARTITFHGADGYEVSFTAQQLFSPQYYYPQAGENENGAEPVWPIIAYRWREGASDLSDIPHNKPSLIIGQRFPSEHNNAAFVVGIAEIIIDNAPGEAWPAASTFPLPGSIAAGETVKLQHPNYGMVKLYYTLDGSEPTYSSTLYNPSTYQPELNRPIPITEPTTIKVLVSGYGKDDSAIAVFNFTPVE